LARSRIEIASDAIEHQTDAELAVRAGSGDREAFEELYRRHARTAMRVAYRVTGNIHDASDAVSDAFARVMQALPKGSLTEPTRFRSYLLTATRHAAVDVLRRSGRTVPSGDGIEPAQTLAGPSEQMIDAADSSLVAAAFRALPERWRSVLWLTEVEGIPAREAAGMLGVSPNGVAQLAVRARNGLKERFLQAHLQEVDGACRQVVDRLGAHVGGALGPRDTAQIDQHLAGCEACRGRDADLREIGTTLRRALVPLPIVAGGWLSRLAQRFHGAEQALTSTAPVGVAAAAVFVASLAGVGVLQSRQPDDDAASAPPPAVTRTMQAPPAGSGPAAHRPAPAHTPGAITSDAAGKAAAPTTTTTAVPSQAPATTSTTVFASTSPSTTTTTAPPPASHRNDDPVTIIEIPVVTIPTVPTTLLPPTTLPTLPPVTIPTVPGLPTAPLPELPSLPLVDGALPLDMLQLQAILGALDMGTYMLAAAGPDAPLPSPDAPGLPV
jgi:RNA polymerase sigma factor (sigma-70 family)